MYTISYKYNDSGIRTQKVVNGTATNYVLEGSKILTQKTGNQVLYFENDAVGETVAFNVGNVRYLYIKNIQGDIIGISDETGEPLVYYTYDSWGKPLSITDVNGNDISSNASHVANINPLRYRGYYWDSELGLYYLNSRYYDPETGRFINADGLIQTGQGVLDKNMFAYCNNNPVNMSDPAGTNAQMAQMYFSMANTYFTLARMSLIASNSSAYQMYYAEAQAQYAKGQHQLDLVKQAEAEAARKAKLSDPTASKKVSSGFGTRTDPISGAKSTHNAIDIPGALNTLIYAPITGMITFAGNRGDGYGNKIIIENGNYRAHLNHLNGIIVWDGEVTAGVAVGKMGTTGRSTGVHLDFQIYDKSVGDYIDPRILFPAYK